MPKDDACSFWIGRLEATGKAQSRFLWLMLIASVFFAALRVRTPQAAPIVVPVINLELDARTVLAAGGPILAFLVLTVLGAIRAWTRAVDEIRGTSTVIPVEALDSHPNAIDLAFYTTKRSPILVRKLLYFVYPTFVTGAIVEAAWLGSWVWQTRSLPGRVLFLSLLVVLWTPAALIVLTMWRDRMLRVWRERRAA